MILLGNFHVHFWLRLSKREHLKFSSAKKGTSTDNFGGLKRPLLPCSEGPECEAPFLFLEIETMIYRKKHFIKKKLLNYMFYTHDMQSE